MRKRVWRRKKWLPTTVLTGVNMQDCSGLVKGVASGIDQAD
jgi:hypothetical protein